MTNPRSVPLTKPPPVAGGLWNQWGGRFRGARTRSMPNLYCAPQIWGAGPSKIGIGDFPRADFPKKVFFAMRLRRAKFVLNFDEILPNFDEPQIWPKPSARSRAPEAERPKPSAETRSPDGPHTGSTDSSPHPSVRPSVRPSTGTLAWDARLGRSPMRASRTPAHTAAALAAYSTHCVRQMPDRSAVVWCADKTNKVKASGHARHADVPA